jgi:hypothetical protein
MAAKVNLWELITTIASRKDEPPNQDKCQAIKQEASQAISFGSELTLQVEHGFWTVRIFAHDSDAERYVELQVSPRGQVTVRRCHEHEGIKDTRSISF